MAIGKKTGGRVAGTPNKLSTSVKDNVLDVFTAIGGTDHMKKWAEENPSHFYNLYAKLLPLQVNGSGEDGSFITKMVVELVEANHG